MASDTVWIDRRQDQAATKPPGFFQNLRDTWKKRAEERETAETFESIRSMISKAAATKTEAASKDAVQRVAAPVVARSEPAVRESRAQEIVRKYAEATANEPRTEYKPITKPRELENVKQDEIFYGKHNRLNAPPQTTVPDPQQTLNFWQQTVAQATSTKQPQREMTKEAGLEL